MSEATKRFLQTEEKHKEQVRRVEWLERRLMQAATDEEFNARNEQLKTAERELERLCYELIAARREAANESGFRY